jgi:hypothetical protein
MPYCSEQDIKDDFKDLVVSESSIITTAKLAEWIAQECNVIDSYVSLRYQTPVIEADSPLAFSVLKRIAIFRTSMRVRNVIEVRSDATQVNSEEKFTNNKVRDFESDLKNISKGTMPLVDAILKDNKLGVSSFTTKSRGNCAFFDVNKQQW